MSKKIYIQIGIVVAILVGIALYMWIQMTKQPTSSEVLITNPEAARESATEWVKKNATTYTYDGMELTLIETRTLDCERCFSTAFMFSSTHSGYGDRRNAITLQVITPHIIEVVHKNGKLFSVTTDGEYDEINQKALNEKPLMSVTIYLGNTKENPNSADCAKVFPVERVAELKNPPYQSAVELLLLGPTEDEKKRGYYTSINPNVDINSFKLQGSIATIDFNSKIEHEVGGACRVTAIRAQIMETLKQFPTIKTVIISVEGKVESALQP